MLILPSPVDESNCQCKSFPSNSSMCVRGCVESHRKFSGAKKVSAFPRFLHLCLLSFHRFQERNSDTHCHKVFPQLYFFNYLTGGSGSRMLGKRETETKAGVRPFEFPRATWRGSILMLRTLVTLQRFQRHYINGFSAFQPWETRLGCLTVKCRGHLLEKTYFSGFSSSFCLSFYASTTANTSWCDIVTL